MNAQTADANHEHLTAQHFQRAHTSLATKLDKLLAVILLVEWVGLIAMALIISPRTWLGTEAATHLHVWAAVGLGGAICLPAAAIGRYRPGEQTTRIMIAAAQGLVTALVIHLGGGRIEWHFSAFVSLAVMASYRDLKVLIACTLAIALDHLGRGLIWPQSIYGVADASRWRWLEHAIWVVGLDAFLVYNIANSSKEMMAIAAREVELETLGESSMTQLITDIKAIEDTGDLTQRVNGAGHEITERLATAINGFVQTLSQIIDEVRNASNVTTAASTEMVCSLHHMGDTSHVLTDQSQTTQQLANRSAQTAEQGGQVIETTIQSLKQISLCVEAGGQNITELSDSADSIIQLTSVIHDIAEQTNLLALNAAIESARAGEHGQGFAVVADEVRKLADRTGQATESIQTAIHEIKEKTDGVVRQMTESRKQVEASAEQGVQASQMLNDIITNAQEVTTQVNAMNGSLTSFGESTQDVQDAVAKLNNHIEQLNETASRFQTQTS